MNEVPGILYLCATPIGNLEDMTPRAIRMLREADIIAAEDTRHTRPLLTHFNIEGKMLSYHVGNPSKRRAGSNRRDALLLRKPGNG